MLNLEKLDQGHGLQPSQLCNSMANINLHINDAVHFCASSYGLRHISILNFWRWNFWSRPSNKKIRELCHSIANINPYKNHKQHFCASSYRLRDINILTFDLDNLGRVHVVEKWDLRHSIANINLHNSHTEYFCASSYCLRDIHILNVWPWQFRPRSSGDKTRHTGR